MKLDFEWIQNICMISPSRPLSHLNTQSIHMKIKTNVKDIIHCLLRFAIGGYVCFFKRLFITLPIPSEYLLTAKTYSRFNRD